MKALLARYARNKHHTLGILTIDGEVFYTLERPWVMNARNLSCIPGGEYDVDFLPRSASGKYKKVFHVRNVLARGGILMHQGNLVSHTKGCILLGLKVGTLGGQRAILNSRTAMSRLREITHNDRFNLKILSEV